MLLASIAAAIMVTSACQPIVRASIPPASNDAPPLLKIVHFRPGSNGPVTTETQINGFPGQQSANKTVDLTMEAPVTVVCYAQNTIGGVKNISVTITKSSTVDYQGSIQNTPHSDGTVPTQLWLWGVNSAAGPVSFILDLSAKTTIVAKAENFTGGITTLTENIALDTRHTGSLPPPILGSDDNTPPGSCKGEPPAGSCTTTHTIGGCEVQGKYVCTNGAYECVAKENVDYCTSCGQKSSSLNCGGCDTNVCNADSDCAPNMICAANSDAGGVYTCQAQNLACSSVACWLPKDLNYIRRVHCFGAPTGDE